MARKLLCGLVVAGVAGLLVGCGDDSSGKKDPKVDITAKQQSTDTKPAGKGANNPPIPQ